MRNRGLSVAAAVAGLGCLGILVGMLVMHAWPLWTGKSVCILLERPIDPRDLFRGDYVILDYAISRLQLVEDAALAPEGARASGLPTVETPASAPASMPATQAFQPPSPNWRALPMAREALARLKAMEQEGRIADEVIYVQLEPAPVPQAVPEVTDYVVPVSASDRPVPGKLNLRGRIRHRGWWRSNGPGLQVDVDYGIEAMYVQEGSGYPIEDALRSGRPMFARIAVASRGAARIEHLILDGKVVR